MMMRPSGLIVLLYLAADPVAAPAQGSCAPPRLLVLRDGEPVPDAGSPLAAGATLQVVAAPECGGVVSYRVSGAELTLIRRGRPVLPVLLLRRPQVDLRPFRSVAQPGDQLYFFIPYQNLQIVAADGSARPYPRPKAPPGIDITTEESRGIGFRWLVRP